jgi:hypothetical protein
MSTANMLVVLAIIPGMVFVAFWLPTRGRALARAAAWDGGLRRRGPAITDTATGVSNPVWGPFRALLRPTVIADRTGAVARHVRAAIRREQDQIPARLSAAAQGFTRGQRPSASLRNACSAGTTETSFSRSHSPCDSAGAFVCIR